MSFKWPIACLAITLTLAGCGGVPQPASRSVLQAQPAVPARAQPPGPAQAQPVVTLSEEEAQAFVLPQPPLHPLIIARIYDGLGSRYPEFADRFDQAKQRILALNRLQLRALHAACFQESSEKTLEALTLEWGGYLERPSELLAFVDRQLEKVEGKGIAATAELARTLPDVFVALEKLPVALPEVATGRQAGPGAGLSVTELRAAVIKGMIALMAARDPADRPALDRLGTRLAALTTDQMRLIHADMWQELKGEKLARVTDLLTTWFDRPATFVADMQQRLARIEGLSPQAMTDLLASYPKALVKLEDLILTQPTASTRGTPQGGPGMAGMQPGMMGGCPCPMMRKPGQPSTP